MRILIPTDFSDYSQAALRMASEIPGISDAIILHVTEGNITGKDREKLEKECSLLSSSDIKTRFRIIENVKQPIGEAIRDIAEEERIDTIVSGARGRGKVGRYLLGSVSDNLLLNVSRDLLIMQYPRYVKNSMYPDIFDNVLIPIELSSISYEILAFVKSLNIKGQITLLHVTNSADYANIRSLREQLKDAADRMNNGDERYSISVLALHGDRVNTILSVAETLQATMILLSRFGHLDYLKKAKIGATVAGVAARAEIPVYIRYPEITLQVQGRLLDYDEFPLAEVLWEKYHQQTGDPKRDTISGTFAEGILVSVARCRKHPDGYEVDSVFTPEAYRGHGFAKYAMDSLIRSCGDHRLFMHSTRALVDWYSSYGFKKIPEENLPKTIRDRYAFALGNLEGAGVVPMMREPGGL
ncbi:MAG: GNAT family N-acetyltransferase [Methanocalculus sp.]|uniref:GNAT family N-acetyltransferase n=1 Tax=Methanocalculus sp. TaxID=2004547 RepID=UPI002716F30D|nr:GNAT family N-acetyltransferase [Methanocalculus sp.]MDO9538876.1 GNAT family N-acetyltransferase [Methanocalculus sp.]